MYDIKKQENFIDSFAQSIELKQINKIYRSEEKLDHIQN